MSGSKTQASYRVESGEQTTDEPAPRRRSKVKWLVLVIVVAVVGWAGKADEGGATEADWSKIDQLLHDSWRSLWKVVNA